MRHHHDPSEFVTLKEAAELARCSIATVYRVIEDTAVCRLRTSDKRQRVHAVEFMTAHAQRAVGRPKGTASHNRRRPRMVGTNHENGSE